MSIYCLFNPYASNGKGRAKAAEFMERYLICPKDSRSKPADNSTSNEAFELDITEIESFSEFLDCLSPNDKIIICGGDGTLNRIINDCDDIFPENEIYLYPVGTGNDFLLDIGKKDTKEPILINMYLKNLPWAVVNGEKHYYINNISFGIDGFVCAEADRIKAKNPNAKINYTTIALRGLLGAYKPCRAKVRVYKNSEVDSVGGKTDKNYKDATKNNNEASLGFELVEEEKFNDVWLAPSMNGRFIGGGMMAAPKQDRFNPCHTLTLVLAFGKRLKIAPAFPSIFTGKHETNPQVRFFEGNKIEVEFEEPRDVQIDGEVILGVKSYTAYRS